ncbi:MAG: amino acid ABC transporter permease [Erysipelotrichaceae bacterium]|nr:amino acid ABC transporter permease [Erysipelotrichaceae bacterium]
MASSKKKIGWSSNIWAVASAAALISCLFISHYQGVGPHLYSLMSLLPDIIWQILFYVCLVVAVLLILKHANIKALNTDLFDNLEKILKIFAFVMFAITFTDRILLDIVSSAAEAVSASTHRDLDFLAKMVYLVIRSSKSYIRGIAHTIELAIIGTVVGFILALLMVFLRIQNPTERDSEIVQVLKMIGSGFTRIYVTIIRGTPMMVQGLIIYQAGFSIAKALFPTYTITQINGIYSVFLASAITVSLNTCAYILEILRGAVEAIDKGQSEAARSLGLSAWQTMMNVVFPQAVKNSIPAICNEFIINIKDTSVLNVIGMFELMFATTTIAGTYYVYLETYMNTAIIYLVLTIGLQALMNVIAKKLDMPVQHGVPSSN